MTQALSTESGESQILVVRHGEGRGRACLFPDSVMERARTHEPDLAKRLRTHLTGRTPPSLDEVGVVWFSLGDPLKAQYPDCYAEAVDIAADAKARGIPVLNTPESLSATAKSEQLGLWRAAGVPCGQAHPARDAEELASVLARAQFPLIVRADLGHYQQSVALCWSIEEARAHTADLEFPAAAIEFIDLREQWRQERPEALEARFYHKKRVMVFGSELIHNHLFFSSHPICGMRVSTFQDAWTKPRRIASMLGMREPLLNETIAADVDYAFADPEHAEIMRLAMSSLNLDVAAIDYSSRPDGSVVLWEANPYFAMPPVKHTLWARERKIADRIWRYDDAMLRLLAHKAAA